MKTGKELQLTRIAMDVRQDALAERMGVQASTLSRWENARTVRDDQARAYLKGLATFGTIPTVDVKPQEAA